MSEVRTFNVYCDESCHLEHDLIPVMAWGAVSCPAGEARAIAEAVRALKAEHGPNPISRRNGLRSRRRRPVSAAVA